jgi:hypothetical protein
MFQKLDLFPSSGEGREAPTLLGPMIEANSKGPKQNICLLPSLKNGNRSNFWNIVFSSYLELRMMDQVYKQSDSGLYFMFTFQ